MRAMPLRRSLALLSGALLLAAPLSSCGFDPATNEINDITPGATDRDQVVDVLGAVVVSAEEGSGTFIASFVNNSTTEPASVEGLSGQADAPAQVSDFSPIELEPNTLVNLAEEDQGVVVEGDFAAGDVLPMVVELSDGESVQMNIPVVPNCREWEGLDGSGGDCEVAEPEGGAH